MGRKIFVIIGGPERSDLVMSCVSFEDGSPEGINFVTHSSCGKEKHDTEYFITSLQFNNPEADILEFEAIVAKSGQRVCGMYNCHNQHGYLHEK